MDAINRVSLLAVFILLIAATVSLVIWFVEDDFDSDSRFKSILEKCLLWLSVPVLLLMFVPSKKDMLMIYGLGSTIDYIKQNDAAKQIPDKCIDALDKFIDEYVNEDKKD